MHTFLTSRHAALFLVLTHFSTKKWRSQAERHMNLMIKGHRLPFGTQDVIPLCPVFDKASLAR